MPHSDDFGLDDDDSEFIAAATQIEASQNGGFDPSHRPAKRRKVTSGRGHLEEAYSQEPESPETSGRTYDLATQTATSLTQATQQRTASDDEPEDNWFFIRDVPRQSNKRVPIAIVDIAIASTPTPIFMGII